MEELERCYFICVQRSSFCNPLRMRGSIFLLRIRKLNTRGSNAGEEAELLGSKKLVTLRWCPCFPLCEDSTIECLLPTSFHHHCGQDLILALLDDLCINNIYKSPCYPYLSARKPQLATPKSRRHKSRSRHWLTLPMAP